MMTFTNNGDTYTVKLHDKELVLNRSEADFLRTCIGEAECQRDESVNGLYIEVDPDAAVLIAEDPDDTRLLFNVGYYANSTSNDPLYLSYNELRSLRNLIDSVIYIVTVERGEDEKEDE